MTRLIEITFTSSEEIQKAKVARYKNVLSKLAPHQTDEILLVFTLAAKSYFGKENPAAQIIEKLGRENAAKLTLEEFLTKVEAEMPPKLTPEQLRQGIYPVWAKRKTF